MQAMLTALHIQNTRLPVVLRTKMTSVKLDRAISECDKNDLF
jgi:hypothetical protein